MQWYAMLVFLHVLGAVGMFAAWGIEALGVGQLGRAETPARAREWARLRRKAVPVGGVSMVTVLVTGFTLMALRGGPEPWTVAAVAEVVLMIATGATLERRVGSRLPTLLAEDFAGFPAAWPAASGALLASLRFRVAAGVAIVALMTLKPGVAGSLWLAAIGTGVGLFTGVLGRRRRRAAVVD